MKTFSKCLLFAALVTLGTMPALAQPKITLSHLGVPTFFTNLTTAITAAVNGDTLYLPGGTLSPSGTITVSKSLHFVGTGHYPDSTVATGVTIINDLRFITGASGGSVEGCKINSLRIGNAVNQTFNGFSVRRCTIGNFYLGSDNVSTFESIVLTDNVFTDYVNIKDGYPNILISRNIFAYMGSSNVFYCQGLLLKNNIIYSYYPSILSDFIGCVLENNIIIGVSGSSFNNIGIGSYNCQYIKNLFIPNVSSWGSNTNTGNIVNQTAANTFVSAPGTTFSYSHNYHLLPTSPGKNYGTDGTDVGIYGTATPYKDGAVPFNPHIMTKNISSDLTPAGILNVNVTVSAQDN
ncbi:MAG: hypothetical protein AB9834_12880 [Lentimicrobium sp.]